MAHILLLLIFGNLWKSTLQINIFVVNFFHIEPKKANEIETIGPSMLPKKIGFLNS
jgi:hypothetical protein